MTINNPTEYVNNLWDWSILDGCFGQTKIAPTDIDGITERNGRFLLIETKSLGVPIPNGQSILFDNLIAKGFTVLVIWGKANEPEKLQIWGLKKPYRADINELRSIVSQWFKWADGLKPRRQEKQIEQLIKGVKQLLQKLE